MQWYWCFIKYAKLRYSNKRTEKWIYDGWPVSGTKTMHTGKYWSSHLCTSAQFCEQCILTIDGIQSHEERKFTVCSAIFILVIFILVICISVSSSSSCKSHFSHCCFFFVVWWAYFSLLSWWVICNANNDEKSNQ